jgi:hypothetical protein
VDGTDGKNGQLDVLVSLGDIGSGVRPVVQFASHGGSVEEEAALERRIEEGLLVGDALGPAPEGRFLDGVGLGLQWVMAFPGGELMGPCHGEVPVDGAELGSTPMKRFPGGVLMGSSQ